MSTNYESGKKSSPRFSDKSNGGYKTPNSKYKGTKSPATSNEKQAKPFRGAK